MLTHSLQKLCDLKIAVKQGVFWLPKRYKLNFNFSPVPESALNVLPLKQTEVI